MKRSILTLLVLFSAPLLSFGQSVWQGSCAVGTYGSLPSTGLYGASNSFSQNTLVTVENLDTNKTATVLIIDRLKQSGLFLLVSKDAGAAIGLSSGHVAQVRVTLAKQKLSAFRSPGDLPYSPDSDVFPAAGVGSPTSLAFLDQYLKGARAGKPATTPPEGASPSPAVPQTASPVPVRPSTGAQAGTAPKVAGLEEPTAPGSGPTTQPSAGPPMPRVATAGVEGPVTSGLEAVRTPSTAAAPVAAAVAPLIPERAGSAPVVSVLRPVMTPAVPTLALAESLAVPEARNPGPTPSGLAAAAPPAAAAAPALAAQLPRVPARPAGEPHVSELAQASPEVTPLIVSVSTLPTLHAEEVARGGGPVVSALAPASPPTTGQELAMAGPPTPEMVAPRISTLTSGAPPAAAPETTAVVPPPEIAAAPKASAAPAPRVAKAQPTGTAPAAVSSAGETQPALAASAGAQRIPVRPSSAIAAGSYYVQLGAYFESEAALALADNLSPDYPVSVYTFEQGKKSMYKVMIGPLNSAESGTLLYLFIAQGYTGAFVRKGE